MTDHELMPAINALEKRVEEAERKAGELLSALNVLREDAELPPRAPMVGSPASGDSVSTKIESDTFFGRPQQTAVREYLEMRKVQGLEGPATPREIYEALISGGFRYKAKDAETALVGLRAMLRKRTGVFVKVGDGKYGLVSWYPNVNLSRDTSGVSADDEDEVEAEESTIDETKTAADDEEPTAAV